LRGEGVEFGNLLSVYENAEQEVITDTVTSTDTDGLISFYGGLKDGLLALAKSEICCWLSQAAENDSVTTPTSTVTRLTKCTVTIPYDGWYYIYGNIEISSNNTYKSGLRAILIEASYDGGTTFNIPNSGNARTNSYVSVPSTTASASGYPTRISDSRIGRFKKDDIISVFVYQTSGGSL
jgi:hypothetical protein